MISTLNKNKIAEISILFMTISIPFWSILNNISIALALIATIFTSNYKQIYKNFISNKIFVLFAFLYLLMLISILYTSNLTYGFKVLTRCSMFIIIPIIFSGFKDYLSINFLRKIVLYYAFTTFIACLICLFFSTYKTFEYGAVNPYDKSNGNFYSYFNLTEVIKTHPIYFGINVVFALSILLYEFIKPFININKFFLLFLIVFFIFFIPLLNSFILIISTIIIVIIVFFKSIVNKIKFNILKTITTVILLLIPLVFSMHFLFEKFKGINLIEDLKTENFQGENFTAVKARKAKAMSSIDLIGDNFLFGVGIGDGTDELIKYYSKNKFEHGVKRKYNSHNQFFTTFIYVGIFGFLLLLGIVILFILHSLKQNFFYGQAFFIIFFLFFLTESVLEREKGIFLVLFFVSLFSSFNTRLEKFKKT